MREGRLIDVAHHAKALFQTGRLGDVSDAALLERSMGKGVDPAIRETAFTALVERHGPMVLRVCEVVVGNLQEAEDAFQATFLVLAREAPRLTIRDSLGPWLHAVAVRISLYARRSRAVRHSHERTLALAGFGTVVRRTRRSRQARERRSDLHSPDRDRQAAETHAVLRRPLRSPGLDILGGGPPVESPTWDGPEPARPRPEPFAQSASPGAAWAPINPQAKRLSPESSFLALGSACDFAYWSELRGSALSSLPVPPQPAASFQVRSLPWRMEESTYFSGRG